LGGFKFRRQHPIGQIIVDFYCASQKLVVEVDGGIHMQQIEADEQRTCELEERGYRVIRFTNDQVEINISEVLAAILDACTR
jgi:very-short-patch-repair endonuclease